MIEEAIQNAGAVSVLWFWSSTVVYTHSCSIEHFGKTWEVADSAVEDGD